MISEPLLPRKSSLFFHVELECNMKFGNVIYLKMANFQVSQIYCTTRLQEDMSEASSLNLQAQLIRRPSSFGIRKGSGIHPYAFSWRIHTAIQFRFDTRCMKPSCGERRSSIRAPTTSSELVTGAFKHTYIHEAKKLETNCTHR